MSLIFPIDGKIRLFFPIEPGYWYRSQNAEKNHWASFMWGELSWGELSLGRVVLIPHVHVCVNLDFS